MISDVWARNLIFGSEFAILCQFFLQKLVRNAIWDEICCCFSFVLNHSRWILTANLQEASELYMALQLLRSCTRCLYPVSVHASWFEFFVLRTCDCS